MVLLCTPDSRLPALLTPLTRLTVVHNWCDAYIWMLEDRERILVCEVRGGEDIAEVESASASGLRVYAFWQSSEEPPKELLGKANIVRQGPALQRLLTTIGAL